MPQRRKSSQSFDTNRNTLRDGQNVYYVAVFDFGLESLWSNLRLVGSWQERMAPERLYQYQVDAYFYWCEVDSHLEMYNVEKQSQLWMSEVECRFVCMLVVQVDVVVDVNSDMLVWTQRFLYTCRTRLPDCT